MLFVLEGELVEICGDFPGLIPCFSYYSFAAALSVEAAAESSKENPSDSES